jgi:photosynthetic reaction center cytochrome c subunit
MKYRTSSIVLAIGTVVLLAGCEFPPAATTQVGYRGVGLVQVAHPATKDRVLAANVVPEASPPASSEGPRASEVFQNVQVLGDLSAAEFTRLMVAITSWVAPEQGCNYCHAPTDLASDSVYTKVVARRMLQMTRHINSNQGDLAAHVGATGVTCYTCHRGNPVPANVWSINPGPAEPAGAAAYRGGQNLAYEAVVGYTSLPYDPFSPYLENGGQIRVVSTDALPKSGAGTGPTIQATEATYGLMMHMSGALGVNCTYCHNSRSFAAWDSSSPARVTAWHAIRTVRDINSNFIGPLAATLPASRKGPSGDALKANCATCHQGLNKPLNGVSMLKDYPELAGARPAAAPVTAPVAAPAATPPST